MTRYHHRFFADTRYTATGIVALFVIGFWAVPEAFLLIPVVALVGANQTAFDASYLFMARSYAASLEIEINSAMRRQILIGAALEDRFLVPLRGRRFVGVAFGSDFSWFGWMTILYTLLGALAALVGVWLGWGVLEGAWQVFYGATIGGMALVSIAIGWWWFVRGAGQTRLDEVIERSFSKLAA